jgi:hypothetical protein
MATSKHHRTADRGFLPRFPPEHVSGSRLATERASVPLVRMGKEPSTGPHGILFWCGDL